MGVSMVLFSLGFFFNSIQSATASPTPDKFVQSETASPTPDKFIESGTNNIGKYAVSMVTESRALYALIINTETGAGEAYYTMGNDPWVKIRQEIPASTK